MQKNLWLEHSASGRLDPKMSLFIALSGAAGYGFFWAILETLSMQNEGNLSLDSDVLAVGMSIGLSKEEGKRIAELAISCDLFRAEGGQLWHEGPLQAQIGRDDRRQKIALARSIAGKKGGRFRGSKGRNKLLKIGDLPILGNGQNNSNNSASKKSISKSRFCLKRIGNKINELEEINKQNQANAWFCLKRIGNEINELEESEKQHKSISKSRFCLKRIGNKINELEVINKQNQAKSSKSSVLLIVPPPSPSPLPPPYNPPPTPLPLPPPLFSFSLPPNFNSISIFNPNPDPDPDPRNLGIRRGALTTECAETQCFAYANALPERLDTPEIRETLGKWLYRQDQLGRTRDQLAIDAITAQWAERPDPFLRSMQEGIANSWKVLIEPQIPANQSKYGFRKETNQEISLRNIRSVK